MRVENEKSDSETAVEEQEKEEKGSETATNVESDHSDEAKAAVCKTQH